MNTKNTETITKTYYTALGFKNQEHIVISARDRNGENTKVFFGQVGSTELWATKFSGRAESGSAKYEPTRKTNLSELVELGGNGWNIYSHPNHPDKGLAKEHIKKPLTTLFCEWDDISLEKQREKIFQLRSIGFVPSLTVYSGGKSIHTYWTIEGRGIDTNTWVRLMRKLAITLKSDPQLCTEQRSMRLPGIPRIAKSGEKKWVEIETQSDRRYTVEEIEEKLAHCPHGVSDERWRQWNRTKDPAKKEEILLAPEESLFAIYQSPMSTSSLKSQPGNCSNFPVPLEMCLSASNAAYIAGGVSQFRNATAIAVALDISGTSEYLKSEGISYFPSDPMSLFNEFATRSQLDPREALRVWRSAISRNPTPARTKESILSTVAYWEYEQDSSLQEAKRQVQKQKQPIEIDPDGKNSAYRSILSELSLHSSDRQKLNGSMFLGQAINKLMLKSIGDFQAIEQNVSPFIPGVSVTGNSIINKCSGIIIPITDYQDRVVALLHKDDKHNHGYLLESRPNKNRKIPCLATIKDEYPVFVAGEKDQNQIVRLCPTYWEAANSYGTTGITSLGSYRPWNFYGSKKHFEETIKNLKPEIIFVAEVSKNPLILGFLRQIQKILKQNNIEFMIESWNGDLIPYSNFDDGKVSPKITEISKNEWIERFGSNPNTFGGNEYQILGKQVAKKFLRAMSGAKKRSQASMDSSFDSIESSKVIPSRKPEAECFQMVPLKDSIIIDILRCLPGNTIQETWESLGKPRVPRVLVDKPEAVPEPETWKEMGCPVLIYADNKQLDLIYRAESLGYQYILDSSAAGSGKSYSIGNIDETKFSPNPNSTSPRIFYFSADRNPTVPTIEDRFTLLPSRHPGLIESEDKKTPAGHPHVRRWTEGDKDPDIPTNCPESKAFAIAQEKDMGIYGGQESPICNGCKLFEPHNGGCDFLRQKAAVLQEEKRIRAHLNSASKPRQEEDIWIIEESGVTLHAQKATKVQLKTIMTTIESLLFIERKPSRDTRWVNPLIRYIKEMFKNLQTLGLTKWGYSHGMLTGRITEIPHISRETWDWIFSSDRIEAQAQEDIWDSPLPQRETSSVKPLDQYWRDILNRLPTEDDIRHSLSTNPPVIPKIEKLNTEIFDLYWHEWTDPKNNIWDNRLMEDDQVDSNGKKITTHFIPRPQDIGKLCRKYLHGDTEPVKHLQSPEQKWSYLENSIFNWIEPVMNAMVGKTSQPAAITFSGSCLTLTRKNYHNINYARNTRMTVFLDATFSKQDLAKEMRVKSEEILEIQKIPHRFNNLKIKIVKDVGTASASRRDSQQNRIFAGAEAICVRHSKQKVALCDRKSIIAAGEYSELVDRHLLDQQGYWHLDSRGSNQFKDVDVLILVGMPTPNLTAMAAEWQCLSGRAVNPSQPTGQFAQWVKRKAIAETIQAIARPRAHLKPDSEVTVYILSSQIDDSICSKIKSSYPGCSVEIENGYDLSPDCLPKGEVKFRVIVEFLFKHLTNHKSIKAKEIAEYMGVSPSTITKTCKTHLGITFKQVKQNLLLLIDTLSSKSKFSDWYNDPRLEQDEDLRELAKVASFMIGDSIRNPDIITAAKDLCSTISGLREAVPKDSLYVVLSSMRQTVLLKAIDILFSLLPQQSQESFYLTIDLGLQDAVRDLRPG